MGGGYRTAGQRQAERAALAEFTLDPNASAMPLNELTANIETEPETLTPLVNGLGGLG